MYNIGYLHSIPLLRPDNFTSKGRIVQVTLKNGKITKGLVISCTGNYADVLINNKKYTINNNLKVI